MSYKPYSIKLTENQKNLWQKHIKIMKQLFLDYLLINFQGNDE